MRGAVARLWGSMPAFSPDRAAIFTRSAPAVLQYNGFPDFYALLSIERDAAPAAIELAIVERGADLLAASFARGIGNELTRLLQRHLPDFRPLLLDADNRRRYDDQLRRHQSGDINALAYAEWRARLPAPAPFQAPARGWRARLRRALWESEYF